MLRVSPFPSTRFAPLPCSPWRPGAAGALRRAGLVLRPQQQQHQHRKPAAAASCSAVPAAAAAAAAAGAQRATSAASQRVASFAAASLGIAKRDGLATAIKSLPLYVLAPVAFLVAVFLLRAVLRSLRARGSLGGLEERGMLSEDRNQPDRYFKDVMRKVRTVDYAPLSDEQIAAARKRRSKEWDGERPSVDNIELPSNHPFAVNHELSAEEEELVRARLAVRRGLPAQGLDGSRGLPGDRPPEGSSPQPVRRR